MINALEMSKKGKEKTAAKEVRARRDGKTPKEDGKEKGRIIKRTVEQQ